MIEPNPTERGAQFWDGLTVGELRVQACEDCGAAQLPASPRCRQCRSPRYRWERVDPVATVLAITTVHRPAHPALADAVPYRTSVVSLGEGCQVPMLVAADADDDITVGSSVAIGFASVSEKRSVPVVRGLVRATDSTTRKGDDETDCRR